MTAPVLQRLLKYPHAAVFDKSPQSEPLFRIRSAAGLTWAVADEQLVLTLPDRSLSYDLSALTVGQLSAALVADGIEVSALSSDFAGLSATVLVDGSGDQARSNGDRLSGFKSLLWSLYAGYSKELRTAGRQIPEALKQMVITQAESEWLDLWGSLYGVGRPDGDTDAEYAPKIPKEAFRIRVNALAIEKAILDITGKEVRIEEPWGSIFRLDESALSGTSKFYDGSLIGYHLIRPVSKVAMDWTDVLEVINRNRAAGVIVLDPETRLSSEIDGRIDGTVWFGATSFYGFEIPFWVDSRLDYLKLSDEEITRNWKVMISQAITMSNEQGLLDPISITARHTIAKASIALSAGPALGDINAVLPRRQLTQDGRELSLSKDAELSGFDVKPMWKPVDEITSVTNARGGYVLASPVAASGGTLTNISGAFVNGSLVGDTISYRFDSHTASTPAYVWDGMIWSNLLDATGLTWSEVDAWLEWPWSVSRQDFEDIFDAVDHANTYSNITLFEDLS